MNKSKQILIDALEWIAADFPMDDTDYSVETRELAQKALKEYGETEQIVRHCKGGLYDIIMVAEHTETGEELIIYTNLEGTKTYARPKSMFWEELEIDGKIIKRFTRIK